MRLQKAILAGMAVLACATMPSRAELIPVVDDTAGGAVIKRNFNAAGILPVSSSSNAFLHFDVRSSGILPDAVVAARLTIYLPTVTAAGTLSIFTNTQPFNESFTTPSIPSPTHAPAAFYTQAVTKANAREFVIVDITSVVKDWLAVGAHEYGVAVSSDGTARFSVGGKEGPGAAYPAVIEIDVVESGSVMTSSIADNAVTTAKILDNTILEGDLDPAVRLKLNAAGTDASALTIGTVPDARLSANVALRAGGNAFTGDQSITGNVGIGLLASASYPLNVESGGSTGLRVGSTASFSVIDIDAASGDAALRFARAGVNQWNTRNRPADDYYEIFELGGGGSRFVIQDGTGNVGIGETTNPTYKLDVLHGGSTGIRSRSSSSFSVIDIDGASGDAALRFAKAGVNQWNTRNRPADDYYEIFELGGGGSRFVIQDGTGNVGIGETTNPTYRLDVLHGGSTGIRSRSSSSFSVVDIDGASGDAALRFARAGVNQWNIRNNPATDDLQFFELGGGGERMRIENTTGNVVVNGTLTKGGGAFKIDHPLDPENKYLYHSFVESPDMMNIYNGNVVTDAAGKATVSLPDYFEALNMEFRYQLTVIGVFAQAIVSKEVSGNKFEIATDQPNIKVSWQVTGIRHDAYANLHRIPNTVPKSPEEKGKYLHPAAFKQPASKGAGFVAASKEGSSLDDVKAAEAKDAPATSGGSLDQPAPSEPAARVSPGGSVD